MPKPQSTQIRRDEKGRVIAEDGYPLSGLATPRDGIAISSLSRAEFYKRIRSGEIPSRKFGRAIRIEWAVIRRMFLMGATA